MRKEKITIFRHIAVQNLPNFLNEPITLTADGEGVCVVMLVRDYEVLLKKEPSQSDKREFVRVGGKLFVEVG